MTNMIKWLIIGVLPLLIQCSNSGSFEISNKTYIHPIPEMPVGFVAGRPNEIPNISALIIMDQVYESLFYYDSEFNLKTLLVDNWSRSNDGREYKIHLKKGILFHNGKEMDAGDVIYTLKKYSNVISSELKTILSKNDSIRKCGDHCVSLHLSRPCPRLVLLLSGRCLKIVPEGSMEEGHVPVGTASFMITAKGSTYIKLSRFKKYRNKINSNIEQVYFRKMEEDKAIDAFKKREVDDLFEYEISEDELSGLNGRTARIPLLALNYIGLNTKLAPFNNVNIRKAVQYAIDKNELYNRSFRSQLGIYGLIPKGLAGSSLTDHVFPYSFQKARELMSRSMVKLPIEVDFWVRKQDFDESFVNNISKYMKQIGLILNIKLKSDEKFYEAYYKRKQQMFVTPLYVEYPEASFILNCFKSDSEDNDILLSSVDVDQELEKLSFETDRLKRSNISGKTERIILEKAAIIPLYQKVAWYVYQDNIHGVNMPHLGYINIEINNYYKDGD